MKRAAGLGVIIILTVGIAISQPGLNGRVFCIDPGHGGHNSNDRHVIPDPGTDFWESESNFQKALLLKPLLEAKGATVILTRTSNDTTGYPNPDDPDEPSLTARWQLANANNVHWFHSIHSNAFNGVTNYTLVLLKEDIPTRQPAFPEALTMSNIISPKIRVNLRTTSSIVALDYTFYGGPNGGFNLGVLRGLLMPGELSEGSFHDVPAETRRLMNNAYRKMEAHAIRNSLMQYYAAPTDTLGIIAGIQSEVGTGRMVNNTTLRLMPEGRIFNGDAYNNGFYMFDNVTPGPHTVRFETTGFAPDSVTVSVPSGATVFVDRQIESLLPPTIVSSIPAQGDTLFSAATSLRLQFSKTMNVTSVQNAFSLTPSAPGRFFWSNNNSTLVFDPDSVLPFFVNFTVRVESTAQSAGGQFLDGDGNGVPGDPYILHFRTRDVDAVPPQIIASYPAPNALLPTPNHVISINFDERLNAGTVTTTNFAIQELGGATLSRTVQYWESGIRGSVNMYVSPGLEPGKTYRIRVSGVADLVGNVIPNSSPILWTFSTAPSAHQYAAVENFDTSIVNWLQPGASGSTVGIDSASFAHNPSFNLPTIENNSGSGQLRYFWNPSGPTWLIREYLNSGFPRSVLWRKENSVLQAYVHGDGGRSQFRFCVDDSVDAFPNGRTENHEVSLWFTVDWIGWRLVEWDLEHDSVGTWLGNGILEGDLRFDSFQMRYLPGSSARSGQLFFDQLQLARLVVTDVQEKNSGLPTMYVLEQNYPNPFNPNTTIKFSLPMAGTTTLKVYNLLGQEVATLVDENLGIGTYNAAFDAHALPSGMYFYTLRSGRHTETKKLMYLK